MIRVAFLIAITLHSHSESSITFPWRLFQALQSLLEPKSFYSLRNFERNLVEPPCRPRLVVLHEESHFYIKLMKRLFFICYRELHKNGINFCYWTVFSSRRCHRFVCILSLQVLLCTFLSITSYGVSLGRENLSHVLYFSRA